MVRRGLHRFIRQARSESGQSLVLAFIVMFALSITVGGVISFTTSNENQFGRDRQLNRAFHIAEAGLNNGIEVVEKQDPANAANQIGKCWPSVCGTTYPLSLDGGTGTYYAQKYAATAPECTTHAGSAPNSCWVVIATGNSPDGKILKQVRESIYWRTVITPVDDVYGFGLFVANPPGPGACVDTHGTTTLDIDNVWIAGDFCPAGGVGIEPTADGVGFISINGTYEGRNNTSVGTAGRRYGRINIGGGCTVQGKVNACDPTANIYGLQTAGAVGSPLQKPDIQSKASALYNSVADWSKCTNPAVTSPFDTDNSVNRSMGTVTLFTGTSYDCSVVDADGVTHRLAWNATTKTLSVENGVYIDGDVNFPNGTNTYSYGNFGDGTKSDGTIYVNGIMNGSSNVNVCGPPATVPVTANPNYGCPLRWDPTNGTLAFAVINPTNAPTGFSMTGQGELDITLIVNQGYADTGSTVVAGPVLADRATIGGNGGFVVPGNPPSGVPDDIQTQAAWVVQPGGWKEQK
jgi:Tfp pilus assembly protein PilX